MLVIFLANNWVTYGLLIAYTLIALLFIQDSIRVLLERVKPLIWVILFTVAPKSCLQVVETSTFQWGFIQVTSEGIINAVFIFLRSCINHLVLNAINTLTTAPLQLTDAIEAGDEAVSRCGNSQCMKG